MIIKYCPQCMGRPYTENMQMTQCPRCGASLMSESVTMEALWGRENLGGDFSPDAGSSNPFDPGFGSGDPGNPFDDFSEKPSAFPGGEEKNEDPFSKNPAPWTPSTPASRESGNAPAKPQSGAVLPGGKRSAGGGAAVRGKVFQYSSTGKEDGSYRRFPWTKLIDAIVYKQRFEDVLHRFYVRVEGEKDAFGNVTYRDVPVNVHGTIAGGMQITDNCIAEVEGKFRGGVLMAERVCLVNDGFRSQVKFQHSPTAILYGIFAIAALIFLIAIGFSSDGAFFDNIGAFLKNWLITAVIVTVLYFVLLFTRAGLVTRLLFGRQKGGGFPLLGIALISLLLTLIFMNSFGIGSAVGGVFSNIFGPIISLVVLIIVIIMVLKLFL